MVKVRQLSVPLIMILLSVLVLGCGQRIPARSQVGQAADGYTPSSVPEMSVARAVKEIGVVLAGATETSGTYHFGAVMGKLGEPIRLDETVFMVHGFRLVPPDVITKPKAGYEFLAVEVSIANIGENNRYYAGVRDLWLRDAKGLKYTNDGVRPVESIHFLDDGATEPGEIIRGEVNFEIPIGERDFDLWFEPITLELQEFVVVRLEGDEQVAWKAAGSQIPSGILFEMPGPRVEDLLPPDPET